MNRLAIRLYLISLVAFNVLGVGYIIFLAFGPVTAPITIMEPDRILNESRQVRQGDALIYQISYCKTMSLQAVLTRTFVGKITYSLAASQNNVPVGCTNGISRNTLVPAGVDPGMYRLHLCATYQLNPLRQYPVCHDTEEFEVLPKLPPDPTSSSVNGCAAVEPQSTISASTTSQTAPTRSPIPFGTDPVTEEPTQPVPVPTPQQGIVSQVISNLADTLGLR